MDAALQRGTRRARKRGLTNKKVLNRKLKMELGCQLKYPTFRQGYTAEIQRLDRAVSSILSRKLGRVCSSGHLRDP